MARTRNRPAEGQRNPENGGRKSARPAGPYRPGRRDRAEARRRENRGKARSLGGQESTDSAGVKDHRRAQTRERADTKPFLAIRQARASPPWFGEDLRTWADAHATSDNRQFGEVPRVGASHTPGLVLPARECSSSVPDDVIPLRRPPARTVHSRRHGDARIHPARVSHRTILGIVFGASVALPGAQGLVSR